MVFDAIGASTNKLEMCPLDTDAPAKCIVYVFKKARNSLKN